MPSAGTISMPKLTGEWGLGPEGRHLTARKRAGRRSNKQEVEHA